MSTPFTPDGAPARLRTTLAAAGRRAPMIMTGIGVPATHETALRLDLMAAGFTKGERDTFMAAWERPDPRRELTPDELMLFQRHYSHSTRDLDGRP